MLAVADDFRRRPENRDKHAIASAAAKAVEASTYPASLATAQPAASSEIRQAGQPLSSNLRLQTIRDSSQVGIANDFNTQCYT
jgi:hypothetical protein